MADDCVLCKTESCCPEHCCDWDTCSCGDCPQCGPKDSPSSSSSSHHHHHSHGTRRIEDDDIPHASLLARPVSRGAMVTSDGAVILNHAELAEDMTQLSKAQILKLAAIAEEESRAEAAGNASPSYDSSPSSLAPSSSSSSSSSYSKPPLSSSVSSALSSQLSEADRRRLSKSLDMSSLKSAISTGSVPVTPRVVAAGSGINGIRFLKRGSESQSPPNEEQ